MLPAALPVFMGAVTMGMGTVYASPVVPIPSNITAVAMIDKPHKRIDDNGIKIPSTCCSQSMCCGRREYCTSQGSCKRCTECPAEFRATKTCGGGFGALGKCERCGLDEWSPGGLNTSCLRCTHCEKDLNRPTLHKCTGARNSLCDSGLCIPGYFDVGNIACTDKPPPTTHAQTSTLSPNTTPAPPTSALTTYVHSVTLTSKADKSDTDEVMKPHVLVITSVAVTLAGSCFILFVLQILIPRCRKQTGRQSVTSDDVGNSNELTSSEFSYVDEEIEKPFHDKITLSQRLSGSIGPEEKPNLNGHEIRSTFNTSYTGGDEPCRKVEAVPVPEPPMDNQDNVQADAVRNQDNMPRLENPATTNPPPVTQYFNGPVTIYGPVNTGNIGGNQICHTSTTGDDAARVSGSLGDLHQDVNPIEEEAEPLLDTSEDLPTSTQETV